MAPFLSASPTDTERLRPYLRCQIEEMAALVRTGRGRLSLALSPAGRHAAPNRRA